ncbi:MAG: hypothetical protein ACKOBH_05155, partial [bacterium]
RCMALLANDRRCPNAVIDGSQFCGLPQHQALVRFSTNQVAVVANLGDEEIKLLADSDSDEANVKAIVTGAEEVFEKADAERLEREAKEAAAAEKEAAEAAAAEAEESDAAEEPEAEGEGSEEAPADESTNEEESAEQDDAAGSDEPESGDAAEAGEDEEKE